MDPLTLALSAVLGFGIAAARDRRRSTPPSTPSPIQPTASVVAPGRNRAPQQAASTRAPWRTRLRSSRAQTASDVIPGRSASPSLTPASLGTDTALRHSAVWAAPRLRADLISTTPLDVFRRVGGVQVEVPTPPVLDEPDEGVDITEWLWATQWDLDTFGNAFGLITARTGAGLPARIALVPAEDSAVLIRDGRIAGYRFGRTEYDPVDVWHERQYMRSGWWVGMSPLTYAAWSVSGYLSAQQFMLDWFTNGATPSSHLRNTAKVLTVDQSDEVKQRFKTTVSHGDPFVTGSDWELTMIAAKASEAEHLDSMRYGIPDIARFFSVPADLLDAEVAGSSITYARIDQRNLQLLIHNLGPAIRRRERTFSRKLVAQPRFVKFNTDATVLHMDTVARGEHAARLIASRQRTATEMREKDDLPPFTDEQLAEFDRLFGPPRPPKEAQP